MTKRIKTLRQLARHLGKALKVSDDGGKTWFYVLFPRTERRLSRFEGRSKGYSTYREVLSDGIHRTVSIHENRLSDPNFIVLPASDAEVRGKKWSYIR